MSMQICVGFIGGLFLVIRTLRDLRFLLEISEAGIRLLGPNGRNQSRFGTPVCSPRLVIASTGLRTLLGSPTPWRPYIVGRWER